MATSLTLSTIRRRFSSASRRACSTRLRWAISCSSSRRRSSLARATTRDSASSRSVRTWSSTRATIGSRWLRKFGRLGDEVAHAGPQGLDQQALLLHAGHQDRRHVVPGGLDLAEELQAAGARAEAAGPGRSGRSRRRRPGSSPSSAEAAVATAYPARSRRSCSSRATPGSSSTSRIVARLHRSWSVVSGIGSLSADIGRRRAICPTRWPATNDRPITRAPAPPGGTAPAA